MLIKEIMAHYMLLMLGLPFNSLAPGKFEWNFRFEIFKWILVIAGISCEIAQIWMSLDLSDDQSTLVQVMAWCRQATSHYPSQWWPRFLSPYGITRPKWVPGTHLGIWFSDEKEIICLPRPIMPDYKFIKSCIHCHQVFVYSIFNFKCPATIFILLNTWTIAWWKKDNVHRWLLKKSFTTIPYLSVDFATNPIVGLKSQEKPKVSSCQSISLHCFLGLMDRQKILVT